MTVNQIISTYSPVRLPLDSYRFHLQCCWNHSGIISALRHGQGVDRTVMVVATIGTSVPSLLSQTGLPILFGVILNVFADDRP